jgi:hypothetical protein
MTLAGILPVSQQHLLNPTGQHRSHAGQKLQHAGRSQGVARIFGPAQTGQRVLHMRRLEESQAAKLHEGNVAAAQLDLQGVAVMGCAEEHRLLFQQDASLALFQNAIRDKAGLGILVVHGDQTRPRSPFARAEEILGESLGRQTDDRIGRGQNRPGRAVVLRQGEHGGGRRELLGKIQDVAYRGCAKGVDRLGIVAHHAHAPSVGPQAAQDLGLQHIGVLVLVDQDVIVEIRDGLGHARIAEQVIPVEQEIVVVQNLPAELGLNITGKKSAQGVLPFETPGKGPLQAGAQRRLGVHHARIDGQGRAFAREASLLLAQTGLGAHGIDQVGRVLTVEQGETRIQSHHLGVLAQQAVGHGVEGSGPGQGSFKIALPRGQPRRPSGHLECSSAGEGEQEDAPRIYPTFQKRRYPMRQGLGLARPCACDDQQRPIAMRTGRSLRFVEGSFPACEGHSPHTMQMFRQCKIAIFECHPCEIGKIPMSRIALPGHVDSVLTRRRECLVCARLGRHRPI